MQKSIQIATWQVVRLVLPAIAGALGGYIALQFPDVYAAFCQVVR